MSSGARSIYAYDNGGWLSSLMHYDSVGATVGSQSYNRDRLGHITTLTNSGAATNYTLDALYRLTTVDAPGTSNDEAFDYDKVGNRVHYTKVRVHGGSQKDAGQSWLAEDPHGKFNVRQLRADFSRSVRPQGQASNWAALCS